MKSKFLLSLIAIASTSLVAQGAAVVSPTSVPVTSASQVVDLLPVFALSIYSLAGHGDSTVNGVTFTSALTQGSVTATLGGDFATDLGEGRITGGGGSGLSAPFADAMSLTADGLSGTSTASVTFSGLTPGQAYTLQLFAALPSLGTETISDGASSGVLTYGQGGSDASYILDSFTAPMSGDETINFAGLTGAGAAVTAANLEEGAVPEPSTYAMMLGGLAVLGFCIRRKLA